MARIPLSAGCAAIPFFSYWLTARFVLSNSRQEEKPFYQLTEIIVPRSGGYQKHFVCAMLSHRYLTGWPRRLAFALAIAMLLAAVWRSWLALHLAPVVPVETRRA